VAEVPVDPIRIIEHFGPHLSPMTGVRLSTSVEPDRLVKTHCCFCGQQCGIQLKVLDNQVIGFERGRTSHSIAACCVPKGVKRYLQGSHPDRLTTALRRDTSSPGGFAPMAYADAIGRVAGEIARLQQAYGPGSIGVLGGASLTTEKTYLLGKFARVCLKTTVHRLQRPPLHGERRRGKQESLRNRPHDKSVVRHGRQRGDLGRWFECR
jgi:assimilatory nitrate reductase catalytic subunit